MRIKILTFNKSTNYGAMLQAFSLNKYLNTLGHECLTINYQNPKRDFSQVNGISKIKSIIWKRFFSKLFQNKDRIRRTQQFEINYLNLTKKIYKNSDELKELNSSTDVFIVGSDQVWNKSNNANDLAYFLHFVDQDKKRISYAASFGTNDVTEDYLKSITDDLKQFDLVSVREMNAIDILKRINVESKTVIDPVFLHNADEWKKISNQTEEVINGEYILCYVMPGNAEVEKQIKKVANILSNGTGYKVISIGEKTYKKPIYDEVLFHSCGPIEFLSLISRAEYIVTNSFHGTAFSLIFNKPFWTVLKRDTGFSGRNVRIESLLSAISLSNRIHYVADSVDCDFTRAIDYDKANKDIADLVEESKLFLNNISGLNG